MPDVHGLSTNFLAGMRIPCGQQALIMRERWGRNGAGVTTWKGGTALLACAKMELRHPQFNFMPRHPFTTEMPENLRRQAAEAVDRALRRVADHGDLEAT